MQRLLALIICLWAATASAEAHALDLTPRLSAPYLLEASLPIAQMQASGSRSARPSTGTGMIVAGWIALGIGLLNLAALPVCYADFYPKNAEDVCVYASIGIAAVAVPLGVIFLVIGYGQRSNYKKWRQNNDAARYLGPVRLALRDDSALLLYTGEL